MRQGSTLEIVCLKPALKGALVGLFREIEECGEASFFHPHPFTDTEAERLCSYTGIDQYYVMLAGERILGYGMLRGWDAGYKTPSLGIFIRAEARGHGLGKLLMHHLHAAARLRGVAHMRLKVYKHNTVARQMYEQLGYVFENQEGDQLVGFYTLT